MSRLTLSVQSSSRLWSKCVWSETGSQLTPHSNSNLLSSNTSAHSARRAQSTWILIGTRSSSLNFSRSRLACSPTRPLTSPTLNCRHTSTHRLTSSAQICTMLCLTSLPYQTSHQSRNRSGNNGGLSGSISHKRNARVLPLIYHRVISALSSFFKTTLLIDSI
ncbi:hypothetical protein BLNAU_5779 [Blattamonas nauphoetae]|uniref:Uncharacterized protein n=1 Tax=Blattamonas nauphoetae TaxID=2049346 RepID=A0ABQ9Y673_9EUKA|nr:hypothetical protein BLNAU_5779 [Blattamonas nauphoetae]